jgi:hypothetical protein
MSRRVADRQNTRLGNGSVKDKIAKISSSAIYRFAAKVENIGAKAPQPAVTLNAARC